ncbi:response regulator [Streptomyces sp. 7N604]|uniref:response regulator n=1 Tax=Streptomyces sp. 7N604 TaxID=3457415 RepID=UPI003FD1BEB0
MTIRLFLVDDHPLFRAGVRLVMEDAEDIQIVGEAENAEDAVRTLVDERLSADVVLMDIQMPGSSGVGAASAITAGALPGIVAPRVLMMSVSEDDDMVIAALRAGAHGYLLKGAPRNELIRAVRMVAGGGAAFSPTVAARLSSYFSAIHEMPGRAAFPQLTERERQILVLIARGYTNRQIARELVLAEKTVRNHVSHVFSKLQITDRASAVVRARDAGLGG